VNDAGSVTRGAPLTQRPTAGTDASRTAALAVTGILLSGNPREGAVINGVKPKRSIPGRAQVVHRELGVVGAQMTWTPPPF